MMMMMMMMMVMMIVIMMVIMVVVMMISMIVGGGGYSCFDLWKRSGRRDVSGLRLWLLLCCLDCDCGGGDCCRVVLCC